MLIAVPTAPDTADTAAIDMAADAQHAAPQADTVAHITAAGAQRSAPPTVITPPGASPDADTVATAVATGAQSNATHALFNIIYQYQVQVEMCIWLERPPTGFRYLSSQCYQAPTYDAESPCPGSTT